MEMEAVRMLNELFQRVRSLETLEAQADFMTAYNPTWTGAGSNPAIGNGTLTGRYVMRGPLCCCTVTLITGSTTTYGSGAWSFSLPFTAGPNANNLGQAYAFNADGGAGARYSLFLRVLAGATVASAFVPPTAGTAISTITPTYPFTWATGDQLIFQIDYEVA